MLRRQVRLAYDGSRDVIPGIIVALAAATVPALSFQPGRLIIGGDATNVELDPFVAWSHLSRTWASYAGLGRDNANAMSLLPLVAFDVFLKALGVSLTDINRITLAGIFALTAVGSYYLFRCIFPEYARSRIAFFAPIFAVLNPLTLIALHSPFPTTSLTVAAFPGLLAAAIQFARFRTPPSLLTFAVLSAVTVVGDVNFGAFLVQASLLAFISIFAALRAGRRPIVPLIAIYCGFHSMVTINIVRGLAVALDDLKEQTQSYSDSAVHVLAQFSGLEHSARLLGTYTFFNRVVDGPYVPESYAYDSNAFVIAATWCVPFLALASLSMIASRTFRGRVCLVAFITTGALFLSKGAAAPAAGVYIWLYKHVPFFVAFRDSFNKFEWIVLYGYVLAATAFLCWVIPRFSVVMRTVAGGALSCAIAGSSFPILDGHLFWTHSNVAVPQYYFTAASRLNTSAAKSPILQVPVSVSGFDVYRWGYTGSGVNTNLIERPLLSRAYDIGSNINIALNDAFAARSLDLRRSAAVLGFYGFGGVLGDSESAPELFAENTDERPWRVPSEGFGFAHRWREGSLEFTEIESRLIGEPLYVAQRAVTGVEDLKSLGMLCEMRPDCRYDALVPQGIADQLGVAAERFRLIGDDRSSQPLSRSVTGTANPPDLHPESTSASIIGQRVEAHAERVSATHYRLPIANASRRYIVILNQTFSPRWHFAAPSYVHAEHFRANLGTNGWLVDGPGSYRVDIQFDGDEFLLVGVLLGVFLVGTGLAFGARFGADPDRRSGTDPATP